MNSILQDGFFKDKKVLITGNTGFKGSWLTYLLLLAGANVAGYSLYTSTEPGLYTILKLEDEIKQIYNDIRNLNALEKTIREFEPEIVIHLAAQPIVRESYRNPVDTYSTNVMGTVNICEAVRKSSSVRSFLNVTTDKVYRNNEWMWGYRETDVLDGLDPYSNSKSCSELITHSYKESFFKDRNVAVSTARAGNVIGGGDFSADRIIPDCVRAIIECSQKGSGNARVIVRNPHSTRPYEHVLEPLWAYIMIIKAQYEDDEYQGCYNVGPDEVDCVETGELVTKFCDRWNHSGSSTSISWDCIEKRDSLREANYLKLDCTKLKTVFGWRPCWGIEDALMYTVDWVKVWIDGGDIKTEMNREITEFMQKRGETILL